MYQTTYDALEGLGLSTLGGLGDMSTKEGRIGTVPAAGTEYARQAESGYLTRSNVIDAGEGALYQGGSSYAPGLPLMPSSVGLAEYFEELVGLEGFGQIPGGIPPELWNALPPDAQKKLQDAQGYVQHITGAIQNPEALRQMIPGQVMDVAGQALSPVIDALNIMPGIPLGSIVSMGKTIADGIKKIFKGGKSKAEKEANKYAKEQVGKFVKPYLMIRLSDPIRFQFDQAWAKREFLKMVENMALPGLPRVARPDNWKKGKYDQKFSNFMNEKAKAITQGKQYQPSPKFKEWLKQSDKDPIKYGLWGKNSCRKPAILAGKNIWSKLNDEFGQLQVGLDAQDAIRKLTPTQFQGQLRRFAKPGTKVTDIYGNTHIVQAAPKTGPQPAPGKTPSPGPAPTEAQKQLWAIHQEVKKWENLGKMKAEKDTQAAQAKAQEIKNWENLAKWQAEQDVKAAEAKAQEIKNWENLAKMKQDTNRVAQAAQSKSPLMQAALMNKSKELEKIEGVRAQNAVRLKQRRQDLKQDIIQTAQKLAATTNPAQRGALNQQVIAKANEYQKASEANAVFAAAAMNAKAQAVVASETAKAVAAGNPSKAAALSRGYSALAQNARRLKEANQEVLASKGVVTEKAKKVKAAKKKFMKQRIKAYRSQKQAEKARQKLTKLRRAPVPRRALPSAVKKAIVKTKSQRSQKAPTKAQWLQLKRAIEAQKRKSKPPRKTPAAYRPRQQLTPAQRRHVAMMRR